MNRLDEQDAHMNLISKYLTAFDVIQREGQPDLIIARIPDFLGCEASGATVEEALESLDKAAEAWIARRLEAGEPIPPPTTKKPPRRVT
jgi:hypothetical protein